MTPRLAFAVAFVLASTHAWTQQAGGESAGTVANILPQHALPPADRAASMLQVGTEGALPVIELVAPAPLPETIDLTSEPEELYARIRQGFAMPNINNSLVLSHQQWYLAHPESLRRMVERSSRYLHHIVEEIEKRGMPMELALLPMVESAYNPTAYSRSRASGLWQFIPSTGKQYKLEQNWWMDKRRDIVASTAAALDYLQYIYDMHGDWHLALASYNWGEGAVGRAMNKNRALGLPTDYLSLTMPEETRNYVPKLQALKNIFGNPRILANLNLRGVPNRPYFATITRPTTIDIKLAAKLAEMPVQEFVALNPAHNRPVIRSETPMVIPAHKVDTFLSNLEAHEESEKPLSSWQAYTLRDGERLEDVAPRFGMTVANLKALNGIKGRLRVFPGQTLLVATQENASAADLAGLPEPPPPAEPATAMTAAVARTPEPARPQADTVRPAAPEPAAVASTRMHTVAKGETLLALAQRYKMTLTELKQLNKLRSDTAVTGKRLLVAAPEPVHKAVPAAQRVTVALADSKPATVARNEGTIAVSATRTHTVQKGETLFRVAQRYEMSVAELKQLNKLRGDTAVTGTRLLVASSQADKAQPARKRLELAEADNPKNKAAAKGKDVDQRRIVLAKAETAPSKANAKTDGKTASRKTEKPAEETKQSKSSSRKSIKLAQYTIRRGDTLGSIARQFNVEKDDLLRWNRIPASNIKPGQTLTIQLVQTSI